MTALLYQGWTPLSSGHSRSSCGALARLCGVALVAMLGLTQPGFTQEGGGAAQDTFAGHDDHRADGMRDGAQEGAQDGGAGFDTIGSEAGFAAGSEAGTDAGAAIGGAVTADGMATDQGYDSSPHDDYASGDLVGSMLDAPDGVDGLIKAPSSDTGYAMQSYGAETEQPATGNSFLPKGLRSAAPASARAA